MAVQTLELQISDNAAQAASNVNKLASAMQRLQNAVQLGGIAELANRLRQISGIAGGGVVGEMATAFAKATEQMERFSAALERATSALAGLRSNGRGTALSQVADDARAAAGAMDGIAVRDGPLGDTVRIDSTAEAIDRVETAATGATEAVEDLGQAMRNAGGQPGIQPDQVRIETTPPGGEGGFTPDWQTQTALAGHYVEMLDRVAGSGQTAAEALNNTVNIGPSVEQSTAALQELDHAMNSLAGQTSMTTAELERQADTLTSMQGIVGFADVMRASFSVLGNAVAGLANGMRNLMNSFLRIVRFRVFRAIIRAITSAFKEGLENVRKYSEAINGLYARDMKGLDNAVLKMKNSLGASLATAIQAALPMVHALINGLIGVANAFNQLMAMFNGSATWTKAVDVVASDFEKTQKSASGAAKAVKNLLADWDELNIIQSNSAGGGGGSGLSDALDYTKMFEESEFSPWVKWIRDNLTEIKSLAVGIGAALIAWRIAGALGLTLGFIWTTAVGIGLAVAGIAEVWQGLSDQIQNGVNWENLTKSVLGAAIAVGGLWLAFGATAGAIGLLVFGVALAIAPLKELIETGKLSDESMTQLSIAIGAVGGAIALLTGSWIPLVVAGIAIAVGWIVQKWDYIVEWWNTNIKPTLDTWGEWWSDLWEKHIAPKVGWIKEKITDPIGGFFTALWGTITGNEDNNLKTWWPGFWEKTIYPKVQWIDRYITTPIIGFFQGMWGSITGDEENNLATWWNDLWHGQIYESVEWINTYIVQPIAGFFSSLWTGIAGDSGDENSFAGKFKKGWEDLVLWFANNVTIPINNFFIDCANGILTAINWIINKLNTLNFSVAIPDWLGGGQVTLGISGLQEVELIPRIEQMTLPTSNNGTWNPGHKQNISGGSGTIGYSGYVGDPAMGPVYYPAKSGFTKDYGWTDAPGDQKMDEQTSLIRQIEALVQDIRNKPFSVNITPSASLGRVVTESQNAWGRTSGRSTNGVTTNLLEVR